MLSGPIKMAKPQKEIFEYVLDSFNLCHEDCLFIDDVEDNIKGAESAGIKGYLFDGDAEKFKKFIDIY